MGRRVPPSSRRNGSGREGHHPTASARLRREAGNRPSASRGRTATCGTRVNGKTVAVEYDPKDEIEKGISAVRWAVGGLTAPYYGSRRNSSNTSGSGTSASSADMDSFDFKMRKPEQVRQSVLAKLKKHGKGIVLLHDFQHATAEAAMDLLNDLKAASYRVVFMKPKFAVKTIASYDEAILKQVKGPVNDGRPTSSVVRTIAE